MKCLNPGMSKSLTLSTFPHDLIRLTCPKCGRAGQYHRIGLQRRFGPQAVMPDVLDQLAACPRRGQFSDACGAIYPDLVPDQAAGADRA